MSIVKSFIDNQRELNKKETTLMDENGDEHIILKAKINSLINELNTCEEEIVQIKSKIDES